MVEFCLTLLLALLLNFISIQSILMTTSFLVKFCYCQQIKGSTQVYKLKSEKCMSTGREGLCYRQRCSREVKNELDNVAKPFLSIQQSFPLPLQIVSSPVYKFQWKKIRNKIGRTFKSHLCCLSEKSVFFSTFCCVIVDGCRTNKYWALSDDDDDDDGKYQISFWT